MLPLVEKILSILVTSAVTLGFLWLFYPAWVTLIAAPLEWEVHELSSQDNDRSDQPVLSLVIPAYNEEDRISSMIYESFGFLSSEKGKGLLRTLRLCTKAKQETTGNEHESDNISDPRVEWIFVDDGSNDSTPEVVERTYKDLVKKRTVGVDAQPVWRVVSLKRNAGKGGAVKTGMNMANGMFHLMVDADGATEFGQGLTNLVEVLKDTTKNFEKEGKNEKAMVAVFGSRAHLKKESTAQRSFLRTILMKAFHFFVSLFVSRKVNDTQCGFKLFTKAASNAIFQNLHLRRWAFDTEVVMLCEQECIDILEVGVPWTEVDGSKLSTSKLALAIVSISMLRDMICVRACYTLGIWRINTGQHR